MNNSMKLTPRFHNTLAKFLDLISYILSYPWIVVTSLMVSTFITLKPDSRSIPRKCVDLAVIGPLLAILCLILLPLAVFGFSLWIFICSLFTSRAYSYIEFAQISIDSHKLDTKSNAEDKFSFATMNILLGQDVIGKFNNCSLVYRRMKRIAEEINNQNDHYLINMESSTKYSKCDTILVDFPKLDFLCFQEVFDRVHALALISMLRKKYHHFVYDISDNSWSTNKFLLNSGLLIASKFPISKIQFHPFSWKTSSWQKCVSYGVVACKVDLGNKRVGILSNLHTMAYEGPDHLIDAALTEMKNFINKFRLENVTSEESVIFDVICGDFNFDNMSPCDRVSSKNEIFSEYADPPRLDPGRDQEWSIGTEMRQLTLNTPEMQNKRTFRDILVDDVRRRHYIIDADVETQTFDLMTCPPRSDSNGKVGFVAFGGMRRIDRILTNKNLDNINKVSGYGYVSALAGLSDHVPVVATITHTLR